MTSPDTRVAWHARWVLPMSRAPIANGAVVVERDRIVWVGPSASADAERHEELGACVLLPGLVNTHAHLELTGLRGFLEGLDFRTWLQTLTRVRAELFDANALLDVSRLGAAEALRFGITTVADCSASGSPLDALVELGLRGRVYLEVFGPDPAQCADSLAGLQRGVSELSERATALVSVGVSPHAPYTVSAPLFAAVAEYARAESLGVATHLSESAAEVAYVQHGTGPFAERLQARGIATPATGLSPVQWLAQSGLLDTQLLAVHAIHVSPADIALLSAHGVSIAHCPISNAKLGQGIAPVLEQVAAGLHVGLGSDSVASNDRMDLLAEARQATLLQSLRTAQPDALSAADALQMATLGGAQALGLSQVGALEPGWQADLCAFRCDALEATPAFDPAVLLVHALGGGQPAALTMVAGVVRARDGVVPGLDDRVLERVAQLSERLTEWRAQCAPM